MGGQIAVTFVMETLMRMSAESAMVSKQMDLSMAVEADHLRFFRSILDRQAAGVTNRMPCDFFTYVESLYENKLS
jgi:hypothetical protein